MAQQEINLGTTANDGTGTTLRAAGDMINDNFDEVYAGDTGYVVSATMPTTIPQGRQVLYNGTMWRGLLEGESSLAAGTPWPVKGYKEFKFKSVISVADPTNIITTILNDTIGISDVFPGISRSSVGVFSTGIFDVSTSSVFFSDSYEKFINASAYSGLSVSPSSATVVDTNVTINFYLYKNEVLSDPSVLSSNIVYINIQFYPPAP